jgi:hypothetical protein
MCSIFYKKYFTYVAYETRETTMSIYPVIPDQGYYTLQRSLDLQGDPEKRLSAAKRGIGMYKKGDTTYLRDRWGLIESDLISLMNSKFSPDVRLRAAMTLMKGEFTGTSRAAICVFLLDVSITQPRIDLMHHIVQKDQWVRSSAIQKVLVTLQKDGSKYIQQAAKILLSNKQGRQQRWNAFRERMGAGLTR